MVKKKKAKSTRDTSFKTAAKLQTKPGKIAPSKGRLPQRADAIAGKAGRTPATPPKIVKAKPVKRVLRGDRD
jgi:hypothetical protein